MSRPPAAAVAESLLAFWAEAGIDAALLETPTDRIAEGQRPLAPRAAQPTPLPAPATSAPARPLALGAAREAAAACADLDALAAAIEAFEGCPIRFEGAASRSVFCRGPADAPVVVIGEAPGAEEDRAGQPFVGKAGRMLDRMLEAIGLADQVFITNTVFWRPPGNRTPTPEEQRVCKPFVEQAIRLVRPRMLLLVGADLPSRLPDAYAVRQVHGVERPQDLRRTPQPPLAGLTWEVSRRSAASGRPWTTGEGRRRGCNPAAGPAAGRGA